MKNMKYPQNFISHVFNLTNVLRTGWTYFKDIKKIENVSDHSYRTAMLAFNFITHKDIDYSKLMQICLLHDLTESIVGDLTPRDKISKEEKSKKEVEAIKEITKDLDRKTKNKI